MGSSFSPLLLGDHKFPPHLHLPWRTDSHKESEAAVQPGRRESALDTYDPTSELSRGPPKKLGLVGSCFILSFQRNSFLARTFDQMKVFGQIGGSWSKWRQILPKCPTIYLKGAFTFHYQTRPSFFSLPDLVRASFHPIASTLRQFAFDPYLQFWPKRLQEHWEPLQQTSPLGRLGQVMSLGKQILGWPRLKEWKYAFFQVVQSSFFIMTEAIFTDDVKLPS